MLPINNLEHQRRLQFELINYVCTKTKIELNTSFWHSVDCFAHYQSSCCFSLSRLTTKCMLGLIPILQKCFLLDDFCLECLASSLPAICLASRPRSWQCHSYSLRDARPIKKFRPLSTSWWSSSCFFLPPVFLCPSALYFSCSLILALIGFFSLQIH